MPAEKSTKNKVAVQCLNRINTSFWSYFATFIDIVDRLTDIYLSDNFAISMSFPAENDKMH